MIYRRDKNTAKYIKNLSKSPLSKQTFIIEIQFWYNTVLIMTFLPFFVQICEGFANIASGNNKTNEITV